MHVISKSFREPDANRGPEEPVLLDAMQRATGDRATIEQARAMGISWGGILQLLFEHGPQAIEVLKLVLDALKADPPEVQAEGKQRQPRKQADRAEPKTEPKTVQQGQDKTMAGRPNVSADTPAAQGAKDEGHGDKGSNPGNPNLPKK